LLYSRGDGHGAPVYVRGVRRPKGMKTSTVGRRTTRPEVTTSDAMRHGDRDVLSVRTRSDVGRAGKAEAAQELAHKGSHRTRCGLRKPNLEGGRLIC
jgi:hypothetical protein